MATIDPHMEQVCLVPAAASCEISSTILFVLGKSQNLHFTLKLGGAWMSVGLYMDP
jgi:hypothetical protein